MTENISISDDLINQALKHYMESGAKLSPEEKQEARKDFENFYKTLHVISPIYKDMLKLNLRGIRWNFNGCICCKNTKEDIGREVRLQRVLIIDSSVVTATNGRFLGTVLCETHAPLIGNGIDSVDNLVVAGALKRIQEEPPPGVCHE